MISCYRRIPRFILTNTRSLFCDTKKLSPVSEESIAELVASRNTTGTTNVSKKEYQMLDVRDNLRILQVTNPAFQRSTGCCIQVEVGSDDSPDEYLGLAHLLEHFVASTCYAWLPTPQSCTTQRFTTTYTFEAHPISIEHAINVFATILFEAELPELYVKNIIEVELEKVDNEFQEKRLYDSLGSMLEILKSRHVGMSLSKFLNGNRDTLKLNNGKLIEELDALHKLYRERSVIICVYSGNKLDMEKILKSLNVGDVISGEWEKTKAPPRLADKRPREDGKDISKSLIIATSDNRRVLSLIFPIMSKLSIQKSNTIEFIVEMIKCPTQGFLLDHLRVENLATECAPYFSPHQHLFIEVYLTVEGLKRIKYVSNCVKNFLHFLHDEWGTKIWLYVKQMQKNAFLKYHLLRRSMEKARHIATHLDPESETYDEIALLQCSGGDEGKQFISKHLLNNTNVAHIIFDRNPQEVWRVLIEEYAGCFPNKSFKTEEHRKEQLHGTDFFVAESTLFEPKKDDPHAGYTDFKIIAFDAEPATISYQTLISEPKDVAFQQLFGTHFKFVFDRYNYFLDASTTKDQVQILTFNAKNAEESRHAKTKWFIESEKEFYLAKECHLLHLSEVMMNPRQFALAILRGVLHNIHLTQKIDPIPCQYNTMLSMEYEDYCQYCRRMDGLNEEEKAVNVEYKPNTRKRFTGTAIFDSINANETVTATLQFFQTKHLPNVPSREKALQALHDIFVEELHKIRQQKKLYTVECTQSDFAVDGFLCTILSVESKDDQDNESINDLYDALVTSIEARIREHDSKSELELEEKWEDVYDNFVRSLEGGTPEHDSKSQPKLEEIFNSMKTTRINVQVIGHEEPPMDIQKTFKEQFEEWFEEQEEQIKALKDL